LQRLRTRLGACCPSEPLLRQSLAHRSYCAEHPSQESNERLEFLGDSVLGLVVTDHLYVSHPDLPEGDLARIRAAVVSTHALAPLARHLGLGPVLLLGRGEDASGGRDKATILADALEALIGAVYLSFGLEPARELVLGLVAERIAEEASRAELGDAKNRLQELAARLGEAVPSYVVSDSGPDHAKRFIATVSVGSLVAHGEGSSKKQAERAAAEAAVRRLVARA
jgi:ribonuclease-3